MAALLPFLAAAALAQPAQVKTGWAKLGRSLVLYDSSGTLANEIGLERSEEAEASRLDVHEIRGGVAPTGRFAWTFESHVYWNLSRDKVLQSKRLLRLLGTDGGELWSSTNADLPAESEPLAFSEDGETLVLAWRSSEGWTAKVLLWSGNTVLKAGPFPSLQAISITPNGRYVLIRWLVPDQSATTTVLEVSTKARKDVPSSEFYRGPPRLDDSGRLYSGTKLILDFEAPAKAPDGKP